MTDWKEQKEAFVSGHEGTTPVELLLIASTVPIGWYCYTALPKSIFTEVSAWIVPMIICQSEWLYPHGILLLLVQVVVTFVTRFKSPPSSDLTSNNTQHATITVFRSGLMYLTIIAILAVDFRLFPRRFCKTEVKGYSLMDLGAASFVVAAGLVSPKARHGTTPKATPRMNWKRILPLLFMGLLRLLTHKGLEYPEHASEYGVHWNFFCTLAFLTMVAPFLPGPTCSIPVVIMACYQYVLSQHLQEWVENAPRTCTPGEVCWSLFVANREGILGCLGYTSLYLASEFLAHHFFWKNKRLLEVTVVLGLLWSLLAYLGVPVSRRTTNASYCVWVLFVCFIQLTCIDYVSTHSKSLAAPKLIHLVNRNGLVTFVVANLMTGLVNLSVNTLEVDHSAAFLLLTLYMTVVLLIVFAIDRIMDAAGIRTTQKKIE
ncbi:phosphatidylinositol glycan, class W [Fistulifera solaris]|jgi:phosphatidylinositol glycan class W|uniref:Phosphatidylinositol glycan, class W n=1 Tax=Fistulifera solaris TaxID=1519565 RepID=A0A1Z5JWC7_FISSO|nr:phosphatidylinositol glycan, class W [Fistulifera solaris]|eukprot:GAX18334.1 phosphatidylinositol glycan, class W [Fistulifera solaris]